MSRHGDGSRLTQTFFFLHMENAISRDFRALRTTLFRDTSEHCELRYFEMLRDYRRGFLMRPGDVLDNDPAIEGREPSAASEYRIRPLTRPGDVLGNGNTRKQASIV